MLAKKWNDYTALCVNVCKKLRVFRMESETACPWTQIVACKCVCWGGACLRVCGCVFVGVLVGVLVCLWVGLCIGAHVCTYLRRTL